jgi:cell division protein FtsN
MRSQDENWPKLYSGLSSRRLLFSARIIGLEVLAVVFAVLIFLSIPFFSQDRSSPGNGETASSSLQRHKVEKESSAVEEKPAVSSSAGRVSDESTLPENLAYFDRKAQPPEAPATDKKQHPDQNNPTERQNASGSATAPREVRFLPLGAKDLSYFDYVRLPSDDKTSNQPTVQIAALRTDAVTNRLPAEVRTLTGAGHSEPMPMVLAGEPPAEAGAALEVSVRSFLQRWTSAWEHTAGREPDMQPYAACYAEAFRTRGMDKGSWLEDKFTKGVQKEWILLELSAVNVSPPNAAGEVAVRFRQQYRSSNYSQASNKTLILTREGDDWKILREGIESVETAGTEADRMMEAGGGRLPYSLYLGSYRSRQKAETLVGRYALKGLTAYWVRVDLGVKGIWYRAFMGAFKTKATALAYARTRSIDPAVARATPYAVLLKRYASETEAARGRQSLHAMGWSGYVLPGEQDDYLLFAGAYSTEKGARRMEAILRTDGIDVRLVRR